MTRRASGKLATRSSASFCSAIVSDVGNVEIHCAAALELRNGSLNDRIQLNAGSST